MKSRDRVIEALVDCVVTSDESEVEELSRALEAWKCAYPRSVSGALRQSPMLRDLIAALEDVLEGPPGFTKSEVAEAVKAVGAEAPSCIYCGADDGSHVNSCLLRTS